MVRKISIISVYDVKSEANDEETTPETNEEQTIEPDIQQVEPDIEENVLSESSDEEIIPETKTITTNTKTLQQVKCEDCGRMMSAKTLKYGHMKYCAKREKSIPKIKIKNDEQINEREDIPIQRPILKRTKTISRKPEAEEIINTNPTPQVEINTSFNYQMRLRTQEKEAKYQTMMSNAFF